MNLEHSAKRFEESPAAKAELSGPPLDGREANEQGLSVDSCPFELTTAQATQWCSDWSYAQIDREMRPDLKIEPWFGLAADIRARSRSVNPYRLGVAAGKAGLDVRCPYTLPRSAKMFGDGLAWGLAQLKTKESPGAAIASMEPKP